MELVEALPRLENAACDALASGESNRSRRSILMNRGLVWLDQAVYSAATFLVSSIAARNLSIDEFGIFGLYMAISLVCVGLQRAMFAEPLMVISATSSPSTRILLRAFVGALALALVVGSALSIALMLSPLAFPQSLVGFAVLGPFIQDSVRFALYTTRGSGAMLAVDLISSATQVTLMALIAWGGATSFAPYFSVWGLGALAGAIAVGWLLAIGKRSVAGHSTTEDFGTMSRQFGTDYALGIVPLQATLLTATAFGGFTASAALRGADTIVGPFRTVLQALPALLLRRWASPSDRRRQILALRATVPLWIATLAYGLVILLLPAEVGQFILGDTWVVAREVMPYAIAALIPITLTYTSSLALKAMGAGRALLMARLAVVPLTTLLGVSGAVLGGAVGAAIGSLVGSTAAAIIFFTTVVRNERKLLS